MLCLAKSLSCKKDRKDFFFLLAPASCLFNTRVDEKYDKLCHNMATSSLSSAPKYTVSYFTTQANNHVAEATCSVWRH